MSLALALRVTFLLAAGSAVCWSARSLTAAARHAVWRVTVAVALALPVTTVFTPAWSLPRVPQALTGLDRGEADPADRDRGRWALVATSGDRRLRRALDGLTLIWMAGTAATTVYFAAGYLQLRRLRRRARPAPLAWTAGAARVSARARLHPPPDVLVCPAVPGPLVTGWFAPVVLIPPTACAWSPGRRDAVLIHELAHVRRGDILAQMTAQVLVALHWFNPLAWHALFEMRRERELACDDEVLGAGVSPIAYASELLAIAAAIPRRRMPTAALSMARPSELEGRLLAVLHERARPAGRTGRVCMSVMLVCLGVPVAGARLTDIRTSHAAGSWTDGSLHELIARADQADSGEEDAIPLLLAALTHPVASEREKAAAGLAWRRDPRVGPALVKAATDPHPGVREKALVALASSGHPGAAATLLAARSDPDAGVRQTAGTLAGLR